MMGCGRVQRWRAGGFRPAPGAVGFAGFGEDAPLSVPEEYAPITESAKVVAGGWSNLTNTGQWNVSNETAIAMRTNKALAARIAASGGRVNPKALTGKGSPSPLLIAGGIVAAIAVVALASRG